jgi:hypothetical protein
MIAIKTAIQIFSFVEDKRFIIFLRDARYTGKVLTAFLEKLCGTGKTVGLRNTWGVYKAIRTWEQVLGTGH